MSQTDSSPESPMISGKLVIITVALLALGGAGFAWWYHWQQGDAAHAFWGPVASGLLSNDRAEAELLWLVPLDAPVTEEEAAATTPPSLYRISGMNYRTRKVLSGDEIRGLVHLRHVLTQDASFDFAHPPPAEAHEWSHALVLTLASYEVTILIDTAGARVKLMSDKNEASIAPIADQMREYLENVFESAGESEPGPS